MNKDDVEGYGYYIDVTVEVSPERECSKQQTAYLVIHPISLYSILVF